MRGIAAVLALLAAMPAHSESCGWEVLVVNHLSEPIRVEFKNFYAAPGIPAPPASVFGPGEFGLVVDGLPQYFTEDSSLVVDGQAKKSFSTRTLCIGLAWLNWRYTTEGKIVSGQMSLNTRRELHIR